MGTSGKAFRPAASTAVISLGRERLRVAWTNAGISAVAPESLGAIAKLERRLKVDLIEARAPAALRRALAAAAKGRNDNFPLDLQWARDFERDVLLSAREIPYGQTRSYAWLARQARRPLAVRAAATVMARNPLWLLIPCHRIIYSSGKVGPYGSAGQKYKRQLLRREGVTFDEPNRGNRKRSRRQERTTR